MTQPTELQHLVARVRRRMILSKGMVLLGIGSAISAGAVIWMGNEMFAALALLPLVLLCSENFRDRSVVKLIDERCGANGALECAWDNLHRDTPIVVSQRKQAESIVVALPLKVLVPFPNRAWLTPMVALGIVLVFLQPAPFEEDTFDQRSKREKSAPKIANDSQGVSSKGRSLAQPSAVQEARTSVTKPESQSTNSAKQTSDTSRADRGKGTGKGLSGATGRRMVGLESGVPPKKTMKMDKHKPSEIAVPTRWQTKNADDGIAQPAQPYPTQYRSVISEWFNRKGGR